MKKYWIIGILVGLVGIIALLIFLKPKPQISLRSAEVRNGTLSLTVTATGYIQPVLKVEVGTQVSGIVERIYADYNSEVKKGQLLAQLDKSTLRERVLQCEAQYNDAESNFRLAEQVYKRTKGLYDNKAGTLSALEEAENKLTTARNAITDASANLQQAKVNLSYTDIYSPISGRVLSRDVDEGQTVASSFNTPTLFTIANDLTKMQVEADVDEADIGQVRMGQEVLFSVDTYPGEQFEGTVKQIRLNPTVVSNVVTYTVIIDAPNPNEKLFPGMTANVTITTESTNGLLIPTEALVFKPDKAIMSDYVITGEERAKKECVYVIRNKNVECRSVVTGANDGVKVMILSGLQNGDDVILSVHQVAAAKKSVSLGPKPPKR